jgi:hypothetical protein
MQSLAVYTTGTHESSFWKRQEMCHKRTLRFLSLHFPMIGGGTSDINRLIVARQLGM